ncbi:MAG: tetratricopeptide repeat protein [Rhodobiaceae bacterium]|nr:tetratricopeptide repeat protein [Rhodobiaceae bacterium]
MHRLALLAAAAALVALPQAGFAAGDGGGGTTTIQCADGLTYNPQTKKCEKTSSVAPEDVLINKGMNLAYDGQYSAAIAVLWQVKDWQTNPRALNYLGYAHRKSGDLEHAFSYYKLALAADPDYTLARSYLGEGYLAIHRPDLAQNQLDEIAARAGTGGYEYTQLAEKIAAYKAG